MVEVVRAVVGATVRAVVGAGEVAVMVETARSWRVRASPARRFRRHAR